MRYRVPEPLPQEAPERLVVNLQPDALRRRHAAFYLALAEQAWQESPGPRRAGWLDRLEREHEKWNDVLGVLKVQAAALDSAYLRQWASELGLTDLLERALREARLTL